MHEKYKANQNSQRRKKQRREKKKKKGRKLIKLKENYPKLYDGSLLFKIFVKNY